MKLINECTDYGLYLIGAKGRAEARAVNIIMLLMGIAFFIIGVYQMSWLPIKCSLFCNTWAIYMERLLDRARWPEGQENA